MSLAQELTVERYQLRVHADGTIDPVQSFDDFVAALRAEAKKPLPHRPRVYAKTPNEARKWQEAEVDRVVAERVEKARREKETVRREAEARLRSMEDGEHKLRVLESLKGLL